MSIQPISAGNTAYAPLASTATAQAATARQPDASQQATDVQAAQQVKDIPDLYKQQDDKSQPSTEQLNQAVKQIQEMIKQTASSLQFSIDKDSGVTVVKVVETESKKVIRQIPSEEVLAIAKALDKLQGLLLKQQA